MSFLTKKAILDADDSYFEVEEVPEWGGKVRIVSLSLKDRLELESLQASTKENEGLNMDALLFVLSRCLQDGDGNRLFSMKEAKQLTTKSSKVVYRLFKRCMGVNKVDIEESIAPKNSETVRSQDSLID